MDSTWSGPAKSWQLLNIKDAGYPYFMHRYPLVICYIGVDNGPFIVELPIKDGDFPVRKLLVYQRVLLTTSCVCVVFHHDLRYPRHSDDILLGKSLGFRDTHLRHLSSPSWWNIWAINGI